MRGLGRWWVCGRGGEVVFPGELDVVKAGEAGLVEDAAVEKAGEGCAEVGDADAGGVEAGADDGGVAAAVMAWLYEFGMRRWRRGWVFDELGAGAGFYEVVGGRVRVSVCATMTKRSESRRR